MFSLLDSNSQGIAEWIGQVVQSGTLSRKDLLKWVADVITAVIGPEVPEVSPVALSQRTGLLCKRCFQKSVKSRIRNKTNQCALIRLQIHTPELTARVAVWSEWTLFDASNKVRRHSLWLCHSFKFFCRLTAVNCWPALILFLSLCGANSRRHLSSIMAKEV